MPEHFTFADMLIHLREVVDITQKALADACGLELLDLLEWEEGRDYPSPEELQTLIIFFGKHHAFPPGGAGRRAVRIFWKAATKEPLNEEWLNEQFADEQLVEEESAEQIEEWKVPDWNFSQWVNELREKRLHLSFTVLNGELSFAPGVVNRWERGGTPHPKKLRAFISYCARRKIFKRGYERREILALWYAAFGGRIRWRKVRTVPPIGQIWLNRLLSELT